MADKPDMLKGHISLPKETSEKIFLDSDGRRWGFSKRLTGWLGLFEYDELVFGPGDTLDQHISQVVSDEYKKTLEQWWGEDVQPLVSKLVSDAGPLFNRCVIEGEKTFRKKFTEKLTSQGIKTFQKVLTQFCDQIGRAWAMYDAKKQKSVHYISTELLPPDARMMWQMKHGRNVYDMVMFEYPPEVRTIMLLGSARKVVFPWLVFFVCFQNGQMISFQNLGNNSGFWAFYRKSRLATQNDSLCFPNLPNMRGDFPHMWCLGSNIPVIRLNDPKWSSILFRFFWGSEFTKDLGYFWKQAEEKIPEVSSADAWEQFANRKWAVVDVTKIGWIDAQFTPETFVEKVFTHLTEVNLNSEHDSGNGNGDLPDNDKERILKSLHESLERSIHFLGSALVIPPELEQFARQSVDELMKDIIPQLVDKLRGRLETTGHEMINKIQELR